MNEELQGESVEVEQVADMQPESNQELEQSPNEGSVLAADTGESQSTKVEFSPEQQAVFDKKVAKDTFKRRDSERKGQQREQDLQRQLDELKASQPVESAPVVPEVPDQFDDDYDGKMVNYQKALVDNARYQERQSFAQSAEQNRQQQEYLEGQRSTQEAAQKFADNGKQLGISQEDMHQNGQTVVSYGLDNDVLNHILHDPQGAAIVKHLAHNPQDAQRLLNANKFYLGSELDTIKAAIKPNVSKAPPPTEQLHGGGVPEKQDPRLKGAIFE
tara:strand:+ start:102 stop:920 length:819 start_codon:yes stop_codon:yes gene_type:complete